MANKKNKSLGEKALEYVGTLLTDGIGMAGVKAYQDYKEYQEENSWENSKYIRLKGYFDSKDYLKTIDIANEILNNSDDDEMIRVAKWYKVNSGVWSVLEKWDDSNDNPYSGKNLPLSCKLQDLFQDINQFEEEYGTSQYTAYLCCVICDAIHRPSSLRYNATFMMDGPNAELRKIGLDYFNKGSELMIGIYEDYNNKWWLTDPELSDKDKEEFDKMATEHKFTSISYVYRKYVFFVKDARQMAGIYGCGNNIQVFTLSETPSDMVFPLGRPQPGLYMAHPVKTEQYFPMKNAEETLFMEKVREFCWLAQCLGAREVSFHSIKGMSVSEGYGTSMNVEANVGVKGVSVGAGYGNSYRYDESRGNRQQVEKVQHFDPKKKAYCPDDLVWLDSDPAWKDLIKQRLNGNMLDYTYKISSSETCQMSSNEKDEVKANFEYMMVKVNGSYNSEKDTTFSSSKETEWSIHVEFAPLNVLTEENTNTIKITDTMETKFNEVPELTDDVILKMNGGGNPSERTEKERLEFAKRLHDKFSMPIEGVYQWNGKAVLTGQVGTGCLEVSEDSKIVIVDAQGNAQSATIEGVVMFNKILDFAECGDNCGLIINDIQPEDVEIGSIVYLQSQSLPSVQNGTCFSDKEQEYLNEVKETIEDYDEIGPKERKRLEKTRVRLGISESRAAELEASICQPKLTDEEKEYLDEVREVRKDYDGISQKERKYLEKTRIRLGISIERANELEKL